MKYTDKKDQGQFRGAFSLSKVRTTFSNIIVILRPCVKPGMTVKHGYVEIMCQSYLSRISN